ncbi:MAG TPA: adenylate/guanylate cyclase domain-containing protein [Leptospiraceae bacterium]|nr:adenylate/guanylate cyclase domain-containing protein [Leptospiraceae bacterium]HRG75166.1 adenylate/guanylate cyclase domain-containing protein [Leptospiraceae bacterium]
MENKFELNLEIIKSERLRLLILIAMNLVSSILEIPVILLPKRYGMDESIPIHLHIGIIVSMLFLTSIFTGMYFYLSKLIRLRQNIPVGFVILNSLMEIAIPTIIAVTFYYSHSNIPYSYILSSKIYPVYIFFLILSILRFRFAFSFLSGSVSAVSYFCISIPFLNSGYTEHVILAVYLLVQGTLAGLVARQLRKWLNHSIDAVEEQNRIKNIFGQHISESVMDKIIQEKKDKISETRKVCVMFLDIRDFTQFSENKENDEIVKYLDTLFEFMIESINWHQGIINKFLGDGFMAVFGAPFSSGNDSLNAVKASLAILKSLEDKIHSGKIPPTKIGIGLHTGNVLTGHIGSSKRKEYTIIGDTVNTASRIESLNKEHNTSLLFSETVFQEITNEYPQIQFIGESKVKGKQNLVKLYSL